MNTIKTSVFIEEQRISFGIECSFFIAGGIGIKVFKDKDVAERGCETQIEAHKHGLAPKVYSGVYPVKYKREILDPGSGRRWAFETQIAQTVDDEGFLKNCDQYEKELKELECALIDVFGFWKDLHDQNIGRIEGKLVCIDCNGFSSGGN